MKRIDDKIKEIEKKDKTSRILYILFVVIIGGFMIYALAKEKEISKKDILISDQYKDLEKTNNALKVTNDSLIETKRSLNISMTPEEFWAETTKSNTVSSYFEYITFGADIERPEANIDKAITKIIEDGNKGWLWVGRTEDNIKFSESPDPPAANVVYRTADTTSFSLNSVPKVGDILNLKINSRRTFHSQTNRTGTPSGIWAMGLKGYVSKVETEHKSIIVEVYYQKDMSNQ